jgi:hypothetical protein
VKSADSADLPLALQASGSLSLASPRESNQREGDPGGAVSRHPAFRLREAATGFAECTSMCTQRTGAHRARQPAALPPHPRRSTGAPLTRFLRARARALLDVVHGWTGLWIKGTVRGAEHRSSCRKNPIFEWRWGDRDGSRSPSVSTGMCCREGGASEKHRGFCGAGCATKHRARCLAFCLLWAMPKVSRSAEGRAKALASHNEI